ncbi:Uncharacterised protein [Arcanobacterium haemolyticum]|uniref:Uncharacterized protein n=1 Tax=Arcanobacterium haemolyticum (strain ATCC 9345 / DSM 20595 / CCM 5947 / CCUG 17215 / LMG 16163 / NBRC 15585 / NCTC 8452 / 11018) TaxID=644284 RepID=D7BPB3_ARCHD|nr:hypothetical protein Arch_1045 [Arcanobacterium haemolyticum DSM 20595]SQH28494.1 Uncharacterised protein [Arcanobacterium haemolyticum]
MGLKDFCDTSEPVNRRQSNHPPRAPIPDALSSPTNATARPMPKLRMHATGATKGIRRSTVATARVGARSAPPTSPPIRFAKTALKLVATHPCRKSTTFSRSNTAEPTTPRTRAPYTNPATRDRQLWMMTDGGEHPGSTPTDTVRGFRALMRRKPAGLKKMRTLVCSHATAERGRSGEGVGLLISTSVGKVSGRGQLRAKFLNQTGY